MGMGGWIPGWEFNPLSEMVIIMRQCQATIGGAAPCSSPRRLNNIQLLLPPPPSSTAASNLGFPFLHHRARDSSGPYHSSISKPTSTLLMAAATPPPSSSSSSLSAGLALELPEIRERCYQWQWKGHTINYFLLPGTTPTSCPPLLLVHGFGASIAHWRRNIRTLAQSYSVYAIDLLGFGASDKPAGFAYTMEVWAQLLLNFIEEIVQKPTVLIGNSIGSLACVIAASEPNQNLVRGLVLLNCAGGMNNKAIVDDWRIRLLMPLLWLVDLILRQRAIGSAIFERVKQRDNLRNILLSIYKNKESVDEILIEIIREPADDEGACDAFVSIITGPPGPNPVQLMPKITLPVLVLWGDQDSLTPLDGPVGKYFSSLPSRLPNIAFYVLEGVGHCPHDDKPYLVHEYLLPWLASLPPPPRM